MTVRGSNRLSHPDETRRDHRRTNIDGRIPIRGACGSYLRFEGNDNVQEEGEKTETDPTIPDAALRLLPGELSRRVGTGGEMAADPVLRLAHRQFGTQHRGLRGRAGLPSRVPLLGRTRKAFRRGGSPPRRFRPEATAAPSALRGRVRPSRSDFRSRRHGKGRAHSRAGGERGILGQQVSSGDWFVEGRPIRTRRAAFAD
jgi:hypothetical protein